MNSSINPVLVFLLFAGVAAVILVLLSIRIIRPFERGLVERLEKISGRSVPGLT